MSHSDKSMIRGFVRRAIQTQAPLLATSLHWYAEAEALSWEELAHSLGCSAESLDQVALCQPPREESFVADVEAIAGDHIEPSRLIPFLRRLQVLGTLAGAPSSASTPSLAAASPPLFLAARMHEEEDGTDTMDGEEEAGPDEAREKQEGEEGAEREQGDATGDSDEPRGEPHA